MDATDDGDAEQESQEDEEDDIEDAGDRSDEEAEPSEEETETDASDVEMDDVQVPPPTSKPEGMHHYPVFKSTKLYHSHARVKIYPP